MWSSLPSNLRTVLSAALVLGIGVAAAAFTLSFFALREAAENPALKFGQGHAWLFPIGVDMALIFFEVLLIGASMVRVVNKHGQPEQYPRTIPFLLVLVAAAGTLYFNATRVPPQVRPIALAVPVASILVTLGLAYLLKMLATASGEAVIHLAPPSAQPNRIVRREDVLEGEITRPEVELSSGPGSELSGQGSSYGAKRLQVQAYLNQRGGASPKEAGRVTRELNSHGVDVSERYVKQILQAQNGHR
jgi:hypothetical protein